MLSDPNPAAASAVVLGAGVMGVGIAQTFAVSGVLTTCVDLDASQLATAARVMEEGRYGLRRAVERGKLTTEGAEAARARVSFTTDGSAALADASLVIEAVPEDLGIKLEVFTMLGRSTSPTCVLASTTSGFPIVAMGRAAQSEDRVIGWHWGSPAQVMPMAEIAVTPRTSPAVIEAVTAYAERCGKRAHVIRENPLAWGFVVNRIMRAAVREAEQVGREGVATGPTVDALMTEAFGWPVGPLSVMQGAADGWGDERGGSVAELVR